MTKQWSLLKGKKGSNIIRRAERVKSVEKWKMLQMLVEYAQMNNKINKY